jgi:dihydroneopterin aldolase
MDLIKVRGLRVKSHIGATEDERSRPQLLTIDLDIAADLRWAGVSDDLSDTVDYGRVVVEVEEVARASHRALLEHLAEEVAAHIAQIPGVNGVTVEIAKDAPPIEQEVDRVAVRIERL